MRILINGTIYDSTITPIAIEFHENEQYLFNGMKKFVSAPEHYTVSQKEKLMNSPFEKLEKEYHRELLLTKMNKEDN